MKKLNRLVIFADTNAVAARILLPALLQAVRQRTDIRCVAIVTPYEKPHWRLMLEHARRTVIRLAQVVLGSGRLDAALHIRPLHLARVASEHGIEMLKPHDHDINNPKLIRYLCDELRATLAINLYCKTRFQAPLLSCFESVVNYHNGTLPKFRGLRASNWSIYAASTQSGYTFHLMDTGMDTGNIICAGHVTAQPGETPAALELHKAMAASLKVPELLDALADRSAGIPQHGVGCEHNRQSYLLATRVADPSSLTRAEWERRLNSFLRVETFLHGRWLPVTALTGAARPGRLTFATSDHHLLRIKSLDFWPTWLARIFLKPN